MRRRTSSYSSHVAKSDGQLPRYGLRKRTAHHLASDDKSHEGASRQQSPPKRPKRTPTFTRAHSPSSRGSAKKRTIKGLGRRQAPKDEDKTWFAEARLKESDTEYFKEDKPVYTGAQCETITKPKVQLLLVSGRNLQSLYYAAAVSPMSFCPQAASFHTPILPSLSKRKSAFESLLLHQLYSDFDR